MPGVAEIHVVKRDDALVESRLPHRVQRKAVAGTRVGYLGLAHQAQHFRVKVPVVALVGGRHRGRNPLGVGEIDVRGGDLVDDLVVDARAVVGAHVVIVVALVVAAELEQVVAPDHGQIVADQLVLAIPEALPGALSAHVVRNQGVRASAAFGG